MRTTAVILAGSFLFTLVATPYAQAPMSSYANPNPHPTPLPVREREQKGEEREQKENLGQVRETLMFHVPVPNFIKRGGVSKEQHRMMAQYLGKLEELRNGTKDGDSRKNLDSILNILKNNLFYAGPVKRDEKNYLLFSYWTGMEAVPFVLEFALEKTNGELSAREFEKALETAVWKLRKLDRLQQSPSGVNSLPLAMRVVSGFWFSPSQFNQLFVNDSNKVNEIFGSKVNLLSISSNNNLNDIFGKNWEQILSYVHSLKEWQVFSLAAVTGVLVLLIIKFSALKRYVNFIDFLIKNSYSHRKGWALGQLKTTFTLDFLHLFVVGMRVLSLVPKKLLTQWQFYGKVERMVEKLIPLLAWEDFSVYQKTEGVLDALIKLYLRNGPEPVVETASFIILNHQEDLNTRIAAARFLLSYLEPLTLNKKLLKTAQFHGPWLLTKMARMDYKKSDTLGTFLLGMVLLRNWYFVSTLTKKLEGIKIENEPVDPYHAFFEQGLNMVLDTFLYADDTSTKLIGDLMGIPRNYDKDFEEIFGSQTVSVLLLAVGIKNILLDRVKKIRDSEEEVSVDQILEAKELCRWLLQFRDEMMTYLFRTELEELLRIEIGNSVEEIDRAYKLLPSVDRVPAENKIGRLAFLMQSFVERKYGEGSEEFWNRAIHKDPLPETVGFQFVGFIVMNLGLVSGQPLVALLGWAWATVGFALTHILISWLAIVTDWLEYFFVSMVRDRFLAPIPLALAVRKDRIVTQPFLNQEHKTPQKFDFAKDAKEFLGLFLLGNFLFAPYMIALLFLPLGAFLTPFITLYVANLHSKFNRGYRDGTLPKYLKWIPLGSLSSRVRGTKAIQLKELQKDKILVDNAVLILNGMTQAQRLQLTETAPSKPTNFEELIEYLKQRDHGTLQHIQKVINGSLERRDYDFYLNYKANINYYLPFFKKWGSVVLDAIRSQLNKIRNTNIKLIEELKQLKRLSEEASSVRKDIGFFHFIKFKNKEDIGEQVAELQREMRQLEFETQMLKAAHHGDGNFNVDSGKFIELNAFLEKIQSLAQLGFSNPHPIWMEESIEGTLVTQGMEENRKWKNSLKFLKNPGLFRVLAGFIYENEEDKRYSWQLAQHLYDWGANENAIFAALLYRLWQRKLRMENGAEERLNNAKKILSIQGKKYQEVERLLTRLEVILSIPYRPKRKGIDFVVNNQLKLILQVAAGQNPKSGEDYSETLLPQVLLLAFAERLVELEERPGEGRFHSELQMQVRHLYAPLADMVHREGIALKLWEAIEINQYGEESYREWKKIFKFEKFGFLREEVKEWLDFKAIPYESVFMRPKHPISGKYKLLRKGPPKNIEEGDLVSDGVSITIVLPDQAAVDQCWGREKYNVEYAPDPEDPLILKTWKSKLDPKISHVGLVVKGGRKNGERIWTVEENIKEKFGYLNLTSSGIEIKIVSQKDWKAMNEGDTPHWAYKLKKNLELWREFKTPQRFNFKMVELTGSYIENCKKVYASIPGE